MKRAAFLAALAALMLLAVPAFGAETTRTEYKEKVEPICKTNREASEKFLKGVKTKVKKNQLKQAGIAFSKAANALESARVSLEEVPQPTADEAKLGKWLTDIKGEAALMKQISSAFKSGNKGKGSSLSVKLTHNADTANSQVIAFGFNYCKIDPSKFS
jgi:hypothetical protein